METATPIALLSFVVFTLLNLVRYTRAALGGQSWNGTITIITSWAIGVAAVWLFAESALGATVTIPGFDQMLGQMGFVDLVLVGLVVASAAGAFNEIKVAVDRSDSAAKPSLISDTNRVNIYNDAAAN